MLVIRREVCLLESLEWDAEGLSYQPVPQRHPHDPRQSWQDHGMLVQQSCSQHHAGCDQWQQQTCIGESHLTLISGQIWVAVLYNKQQGHEALDAYMFFKFLVVVFLSNNEKDTPCGQKSTESATTTYAEVALFKTIIRERHLDASRCQIPTKVYKIVKTLTARWTHLCTCHHWHAVWVQHHQSHLWIPHRIPELSPCGHLRCKLGFNNS